MKKIQFDQQKETPPPPKKKSTKEGNCQKMESNRIGKNLKGKKIQHL